MAVGLAISAAAPPFSAVTYRLFTSARRLTLPLALRTSWKVSHKPIAARLATNDAAPAFSAVTIRLLACARSAMAPPPASRTRKGSHAPTAVRLAISGAAPAFSAQTYPLFACARSAITPVPPPPRTGGVGRGAGRAGWALRLRPASPGQRREESAGQAVT